MKKINKNYGKYHELILSDCIFAKLHMLDITSLLNSN